MSIGRYYRSFERRRNYHFPFLSTRSFNKRPHGGAENNGVSSNMAATTFDARHSERIDLDPVTENTSSGLAYFFPRSCRRAFISFWTISFQVYYYEFHGKEDIEINTRSVLLSGRSSWVAELLRFNDDNKMSNVPTGERERERDRYIENMKLIISNIYVYIYKHIYPSFSFISLLYW